MAKSQCEGNKTKTDLRYFCKTFKSI